MGCCHFTSCRHLMCCRHPMICNDYVPCTAATHGLPPSPEVPTPPTPQELPPPNGRPRLVSGGWGAAGDATKRGGTLSISVAGRGVSSDARKHVCGCARACMHSRSPAAWASSCGFLALRRSTHGPSFTTEASPKNNAVRAGHLLRAQARRHHLTERSAREPQLWRNMRPNCVQRCGAGGAMRVPRARWPFWPTRRGLQLARSTHWHHRVSLPTAES